MSKDQTNPYLVLLIIIVMLLLLTNVGLFVRMLQLQQRVLEALEPLTPQRGLDIGDKAPGFVLNNFQGHTVSLEDFKGKPLLLVFSSTTCSICQQFWPTLSEFSRENPDIPILMVSYGSAEESNKMIMDYDFDFSLAA